MFLVGGVVMHLLGVTIALASGAPLNLSALLWGQIAISATQWMTHYSNDYFDLEADCANRTPTHWSGGSRVLLNGMIPARWALIAALIFMAIALIAASILTFVIRTGSLTLPLIVLALGLAWFYSAPPIRLHSRGLGELTTAVIVPGLAPLTGYYLQRGHLEPLPFLAVLPLCLLQFCMLLAIEFPDADGDRTAGKQTVVVRLGETHSKHLYTLVLLCAYLMLPLLVIARLPGLVALAVGLMSPLALAQIVRIRHLEQEGWNTFAFFSIALLFGTAVVELVAFVALIGLK